MMEKIRAYTLVELLLVLCLSLVISTVLLSFTLHALNILGTLREKRIALQRCQMTLAILLEPLTHCAYGIPNDETGYRAAFSYNSYPPFNWQGPINTSDSVSAKAYSRTNALCRIAYAVPSGVFVRRSVSVDASENLIELDREAEHTSPKIGIWENPGNWVLFASTQPSAVPLLVTGRNSMGIKVRVGAAFEEYRVLENDELCYFRVMEAKAENGIFYTNDYSGSGMQPRVDGIVDVRFDLDRDKRLLTVSVLSRGDAVRSTLSKVPEKWPQAYIGEIPPQMFTYFLAAEQFTLALRNWDL